MEDLAREFLARSREFLKEDYLPKIEQCVAQLTDEQIWSRANDASNSIGNLILHLTGSSRYWALEVIGGTPIGRVRQKEFDQRAIVPSDPLLAQLRNAMNEVDQQLAKLQAPDLMTSRTGRDETYTVLWCVYHIVEHFGMHTGQILTMTKAMIGELAPQAS